MYAVNRWRVTGPVLGLIDSICQHLSYWPVPAQPAPESPACDPAAPAPVAEAQPEPEPLAAPLLGDAGQPSVA
jgi:hypothetical protein